MGGKKGVFHPLYLLLAAMTLFLRVDETPGFPLDTRFCFQVYKFDLKGFLHNSFTVLIQSLLVCWLKHPPISLPINPHLYLPIALISAI